MVENSIAHELRQIVGADAVLDKPEDLQLYTYDGSTGQGRPEAVCFPQTTEHVSRILKFANKNNIPIVPRGAGTGLSGGSIARQGGIVLGFARMNKVLEVDAANHRATVQPGVVNIELSNAVAHLGLYFAPDPSSQRACTIGGNVAENSGGPHTLASGVTVNHVTGLEVVLPDGRVTEFGGKTFNGCGYDLTGFFIGSEGTLGVATKITVKLMRLPESVATLLAIFNTVEDAAQTVVALTSSGITPAALELLDGLMLRAVEDAYHAGYPLDSGAVLLIELEGLREEVEEYATAVEAICKKQNARETRRAKTEEERTLLWMGRKHAFGAIGRLASGFYTQDGVIPRTKIPQTLQFIETVGKKYSLRIGNVFHAGDGNLHPLIMYDIRDPHQAECTLKAGEEILQYCIDVGGSITGEHGVGMEKIDMMPKLFSPASLEVMKRLRNVFNPLGILNPAKMIPGARSCRETTMPGHASLGDPSKDFARMGGGAP